MRPTTVSTAKGSQPRSLRNYTSFVALNDRNYQKGVQADPVHMGKLKRTRSPPLPLLNDNIQENSHLIKNHSRAPGSLLMSNMGQGVGFSRPDSSGHQIDLSPSAPTFEATMTKPIRSPAPKRRRLPSSLPSVQDLQQKSYSSHEEIEREMQAKAKRLSLFKVELSQSRDSISAPADLEVSSTRHDPSTAEGGKSVGELPNDLTGDFPWGSFEYEDVEPTANIIGLCPDMCPESERAERQRKGDLDQYERVEGDRNQTSKLLAIKKYNRTAEGEAALIRPIPVLVKTTDYLLNLLDQPYDNRFLGLYNFLWDRMRAIRMDLRMQHIFNLDAVKMFEQMIRLHIIAMHELCECTEGEGFSKGFNAHLNIEQMNKTLAELFQLYDDQRKKGITVATENEFRGYYALLKLNKHPSYQLEPGELLLQLAKMKPKMRQAPEVLFARGVARACRTGNFIAFFQLARKANYLQACLMHAHFAKLRSQALASLHSGLLNNKGLPVAVVARWLAMEGGNMESLLEYHGFGLKDYEEPYMVKKGPFLNAETDFPTKRSMLVHLKKSTRIIKDVLFNQVESSPSKEKAEFPLTLGVVSAVNNEASKVLQDVNNQDEEVAEAKLKLIIRSWKRHSAKRRELHERRLLAVIDALNSLSLGPPLERNTEQLSTSKSDTDQVTKKRHGKHRQSWSRPKVAEVAADEIINQNPSAKDSHVDLGCPFVDETLETGCDDGSSATLSHPPGVVQTVADVSARDQSLDTPSFVVTRAHDLKISLDNESPASLRDDKACANYTWKSNGNIQLSSTSNGEREKLNKLLQQCNAVQNRIDGMLSIYFPYRESFVGLCS